MRSFLTHLLTRLRLTLAGPGALVMVLLAGLSSLLLWPWLLGRLVPAEQVLDPLIQPMMLFMWPMMLAIAATAPMPTGANGKGFGVRALPALPVGPVARTLAELLPPLFLALLVRFAGGELLRLWLGTRDPFSIDPQDGWAFATDTLVGTSIMLPVLAAWRPRPRVDWTYIIRPAVAAVVMFALLKQGSITDLSVAPWIGLLLAAGFYAVPDFEASRRVPTGRAVTPRQRASRSRRGLDPRSRMRRDLWTGSLRSVAPFAGAFLLLSLAVPLADRLEAFPVEQTDLWYGIVHGLSLSLFGIASLHPMGIHILKTDRLAGSGGLMSGAFCAAWAALPVRRESVSRAVYFHVLLLGAAWLLFITSFSLLAHLVVSNGLSWLLFYPPLVLALPALAGFLTCMAVGDRLRGTIALAALFLVMPAHIGSRLACDAAGMSARSPVVLAINAAALLLLGAVGGLPALVHVRRASDPDDRWRKEIS
jgi:hypothetical protein